MKDQKKNDLKKAAEAIEQLYRAISNDKISVVPDMEHEYIVVTINGAIYRVNVAVSYTHLTLPTT